MSTQFSPAPRRGRALWLIAATLLVGYTTALLWKRAQGDPSGGGTQDQRGERAQALCPEWIEEAATQPTRLDPFLGPGWDALRERDPARAQEEAALAPPEHRRALQARADIMMAGALLAAWRAALGASAVYLELRLTAPLQPEQGDEVYFWLRASTALQAGEELDVGPLLAKIPADSPLAASARVLAEIAADPLPRPARSIVDPALRWVRHLPELQAALPSQGCPLPGQFASRLRALAELWRAADAPWPPPSRWSQSLELGKPDFELGTCGGDPLGRVDLYDPSTYTVLAALAARRASESRQEPGPIEQIDLLARIDGEAARALACEWRESPPPAELEWVVYGGSPALTTWRDTLSAWCERGAPDVVGTGPEAIRDLLHAQERWEASCLATLREKNPEAADVAEVLGLYGAVAARPTHQVLGSPTSPPMQVLEGMPWWSGNAGSRPAWDDLATRLRWIELSVRRGLVGSEGVQQARDLAALHPFLYPLDVMVQRVQRAWLSRQDGAGQVSR